MTPDIPRRLCSARGWRPRSLPSVLESVQKSPTTLPGGSPERERRRTRPRSSSSALPQLPQYDPDQPFLPWFRRLATNCTLNWKEKRRPTSELPEQIAVHDAAPSIRRAAPQAIRELPGAPACVP
jgi:hypothetical protein